MKETRPTRHLDRGEREHLLVQGFSLRIVSESDGRRPYKTKKDSVTIGTHESCDFILSDPTMSRFHCEIRNVGGKPLVRDLGSRNGTWLDGVHIQSAFLRDQAILALGKTRMRFEVAEDSVKVPLSRRQRFGLLVGQSPVMRAVFDLLESAAQSKATVLLQGETGTGKDAAAESIHMESERKNGPLVVVDCGAVPPNLLESELFGHNRGAFTGAEVDRPGAFETAHRGTLFLDEVAELGLDLQPKLLRALETRRVRRVGSTKSIAVDVRVIAATNRNLRERVNIHQFRSDLYYRLAVLTLTLPPLRERTEDLPLLVDDLLTTLDPGDPNLVQTIRSETFLDGLKRQSWPGNVRELRNHLERCLAAKSQAPPEPPIGKISARSLPGALEEFERKYIEEILRMHPDNLSAAARAAGISRVQLYRLLTRHGLR